MLLLYIMDITDIEFVSAMRERDYDRVRQYIADGYDVNDYSPDFISPLFIAVRDGDYDMVKILVEAGADINTPNDFGLSPLILAERKGDDRIIGYLKGQLSKLRRMPLIKHRAMARAKNPAIQKAIRDAEEGAGGDWEEFVKEHAKSKKTTGGRRKKRSAKKSKKANKKSHKSRKHKASRKNKRTSRRRKTSRRR